MEDKKDVLREAKEWIFSILWAVVLAFLIKTFIFNTTYVVGISMEPTLYEGDRLFAQKVTLYFKPPEAGQIIIHESPIEEDKDYIKRVIAVEGDTVSIENGKVYVNSKELKESYIDDNIYTDFDYENIWQVPKDHIFVMGDNRHPGASTDGRVYGPIPVDTVKGIANFRFYPFDNRFGRLK